MTNDAEMCVVINIKLILLCGRATISNRKMTRCESPVKSLLFISSVKSKSSVQLKSAQLQFLVSILTGKKGWFKKHCFKKLTCMDLYLCRPVIVSWLHLLYRKFRKCVWTNSLRLQNIQCMNYFILSFPLYNEMFMERCSWHF